MKIQEKAELLVNEQIQGDYRRWVLRLPEISRLARPGQFVHVQIPCLGERILRRPFSISDADGDTGTLTLVYKVVGEGTDTMKDMSPGATVDVLGPLGHGFSPLPDDRPGILLGGGYGCAAVFFLARISARKPIVLLGGRTATDIILADDFRRIGCDVRIATNDGSLGEAGLITAIYEKALLENPGAVSAACGPVPMLKATARMAAEHQVVDDCEVSMDAVMCCGVGACFGCVVKVVDETGEQGWKYERACHEGPVFPATRVYWD